MDKVLTIEEIRKILNNPHLSTAPMQAVMNRSMAVEAMHPEHNWGEDPNPEFLRAEVTKVLKELKLV